MRHWLQLATKNWRAKPGRAAGIATAIALGVGTVVWVTSTYESARRSISDQVVDRWVGKSHLSIESALGHWGHIDAGMESLAASLDDVRSVTARLRRRLQLSPGAADGRSLDLSDPAIWVDVVGIEPETEYGFRTYRVHGRRIEPQERGVTMIETGTAKDLGLSIGDRIVLFEPPDRLAGSFTIVGVFDARRVAKFQRPTVLVPLTDLQSSIVAEAAPITIVDIMLNHPTAATLEATAESLRKSIRQSGRGYQVTTSTAKLNQLAEAERQTEFALMMVASVALLTAFFIISSTMSMGTTERVAQMGTLRCLGVTRGQLAALVFAEVAPAGAIGIILGVPIGLGLTYVGTRVAPEYIQQIAISPRGIIVAIIGGGLTTLASGFAPAIRAAATSPLAASRPRANPPAKYWPVVAAVAGLCMVAGQAWMVSSLDPSYWFLPQVAFAGIALLYVGYALVIPLAVRLIAAAVVPVVARMLLLDRRLLNDQVGRVAWRGASICCGLMVGLSLLISVSVYAESVRVGWDFPRRLAESFVWTRDPVSRPTAELVRDIPGVEDCTFVNDFLTDVGRSRSRLFNLFRVKTTFVAGEPDVFLDMTKLEFHEGELEDARAKLKRGGYVLLPHEASRALSLHLGDTITLSAAGRTARFEVAGVVQSPALDIAVTYFQADSYMMLAAANSVLGTLSDAKERFGIDGVSMFLMNFSLPTSETPELFRQASPPIVTTKLMATELLAWGDRLTNDLDEMALLRPRLEAQAANASGSMVHAELLAPYRAALSYVADRWADRSPQQRWGLFCDRLVMLRVINTIDRPSAIFGSLRELKQRIDDDIHEATLLLSAIPIVALIVAAVGVGNLMTTNVLNRTREVGVLRAIGTTRWQIMRLVLGEALVLGMIGSVAGVGLGIHAAGNMNHLTLRAIGFAPGFHFPVGNMAAGIALTVGVCVLAGVAPARRAARLDITQAMRAA